MCMKNFGAKIFFGDKFLAVKFELSHFFYHCTAYVPCFNFQFSLNGRTIALIVTVPCHFLSFFSHDHILFLFYLGQSRL